jgi:hypothetical protein
MKRFVSLQFLNHRQSVGLLRLGISPTQGRYLRRTTQTQIQTHNFGFQVDETFHALVDRSATLIRPVLFEVSNFSC